MKLSTRTRYGTRALVELALREEKGESPVSIKDIAKSQNLSLPYLEHLVTPLIAAGIIRSIKGPRGGITFNRKPADITLKDITGLLEGSLAPVDCVDCLDVCDRSGLCVTREIWEKLKEAMDEVLETTTLKDLAEKQKKNQATLVSQ